MVTKYSDIVKLRGGKAAYNIEEEKQDEWSSFIPNEQFNGVLRTVIKSVRGNDIDNHKSFWINGTYGTGKSHAVAVLSHLLSDLPEEIKKWVDYEYSEEKFSVIRNSIYALREEKKLLPIKVYGLNKMTHATDLALVLQRAVAEELKKKQINAPVKTDFQVYTSHVVDNPKIWDSLIESNTALSSIVTNRQKLIANLEAEDIATFHRVSEALRKIRLDVRLENENIGQWLLEVQNVLIEKSDCNGLLIIWDEFTDVMTDPIGKSVLKKLQEVAEKFSNKENNSYLFLISHPSAFNNISAEELKQTDGRYHRMKYNMESVSAFKIMSRKFDFEDIPHYNLRQNFFDKNKKLLEIFSASSNDAESTRRDLQNLYPLHPATANLATHYATVIGSSSRSVFEFLGQNDAIREFLDSEQHFCNKDTITADYLWDYVYKVFIDDVMNYGAVTERYNSYWRQVDSHGEAYSAVFKGVLLLNAFNNISGENNQGLVTPSEENIHLLFMGTRYEVEVENVLNWFNEQGIIQRAPGGIFSIQFSALPSSEIEEKKNELRNSQFRFTSQILKFSDAASSAFEKRFVQTSIRSYCYEFYSDVNNESTLRNQIKNGKKTSKSSDLFLALLFAKNNTELVILKSFAEKISTDTEDKDMNNIVFIVFDEILTDKNYERFIEYQANYACASSHGFVDQTKVHRDHAIDMVKEWLSIVQRGNATLYIKYACEESSCSEVQPISVKHLSSTLNSGVAPLIFPAGPDALELLRQKAPKTFWKPQISKEIVRSFIFATTKSELVEVNAVMRPVQYLLQDSVDENLRWKIDIPKGHQLKAVCDFIEKKIKFADKSLPFNFVDKFIDLTRPPFGLYNNYAAMAMVAFALRPWVNKIFDQMGKPRDENNLVEDVSELFRAWDTGKSSNKLNFKFQTPEEGKLCKSIVNLFKLNSIDNDYNDITSLKDARFALTGGFLKKKGYPLWSLKYVDEECLAKLPVMIVVDEKIKKLIENIVIICAERDLRNLSLMKETLILIEDCHIDIRNLLISEVAFKNGFNTFLKKNKIVNLEESEIDEAYKYINAHLQSTVGYWTEEEVSKALMIYRIEKDKKNRHTQNDDSNDTATHTSEKDSDALANENDELRKQVEDAKQRGFIPQSLKSENENVITSPMRDKAKEKINNISSLEDAKSILENICTSAADDQILQIIIDN